MDMQLMSATTHAAVGTLSIFQTGSRKLLKQLPLLMCSLRAAQCHAPGYQARCQRLLCTIFSLHATAVLTQCRGRCIRQIDYANLDVTAESGLQGTLNLIAAAKQAKVKKFVLVTSIGTDDLLNPLNLFFGVCDQCGNQGCNAPVVTCCDASSMCMQNTCFVALTACTIT